MHHELVQYLLALALLLGIARGMGDVCRRLGFPAVVGELMTGLVMGKTLLGRVSPAAYAWLFPEGHAATLLSGYTTVGVTLLLVVAGLEIDLSVVRRSGRVVILTALFGLVIPFALGLGAGMFLPDADLADPSRRAIHAAFLGIALSISALPVIAKTLLDLGLMKTDFGLFVLSAAVIDDLCGWIAFSVLARAFRGSTEAGLKGVGLSTLFTIGFVGLVLLIVRPLADRIFARFEVQEHSQGRMLSLVMVLALLGAAATQALGMHAVFGGFVVGIAIGDSSRLREHTRQILHDFVMAVFTPVFFATIALRFDFAASFDARLVALVLTIACVAKIAGAATGARLAGIAWRQATAIGFGLNSRGAMEILLALIALEAGIIGRRMFVALVVMAIVTSLLSGPALARLLRAPSSPIADLLRAGAVTLDPRASSREELIRVLSTALAIKIGRPKDGDLFADQVLTREALAGTGVGDGVAFPHADIEGLAQPILAFARVEDGVDFDAPDGERATLIFLLLTPSRHYDESLKILSAMARLLSREDVRKSLLRAKTEPAVLSALDNADRASALSTPIPR